MKKIILFLNLHKFFFLFALIPFLTFSQTNYSESELKNLVKRTRDKRKSEYLYLLDKMYKIGTSEVEPNLKKSMKCFEEASILGSDSAQYALALLHRHGGDITNLNEALKHYKLASQKEHILALLDLGRIYKNGLHYIEKNHHKAARYFLLAWQADSTSAKLELDQIPLLNLSFSDEALNKTYLHYLASHY